MGIWAEEHSIKRPWETACLVIIWDGRRFGSRLGTVLSIYDMKANDRWDGWCNTYCTERSDRHTLGEREMGNESVQELRVSALVVTELQSALDMLRS
jgi:hypothetical protein